MKWIRSQDEAVPHFKSSVLTIGNFDGLHLGHQKLIKKLLQVARENNTVSVVCTFRPHPRTVLKPNEPHHKLFDYRDQVEVLTQMGVDYLVEEKFSKDLALMSAEDFLNNYIIKVFNPTHIVVGYDFSFGKGRGGNIEFLKKACAEKGIGLDVVDAYVQDGQVISSTLLRLLLEHGQVQKVKEYLGRPYYLRGPVRVGNKRGRTIGTPTANISPEIEFIPRKGVYFTWAYLKDKKYASITNIGFNPTFENTDSYLKVETHIFDFNEDIYGEHLKIELVQFHRDEMRFSSVEALKHQISNDIVEARKFFGEIK
ncbi:MAG: bifunctional riboflavin kinase/FAD synthetase [Pseudobdellovibrio sp.]